MNKLILLRHGQSQWNLENKFTGWKNVPLTEKGEIEAKKAGELIKKNKYLIKQIFYACVKCMFVFFKLGKRISIR